MSFINPNPAGGGGGGAVSSVNGQTGAVVLGAADVGAYTTAQVDALIAGLQTQINQRVKLIAASAVTLSLTGTTVKTTLASIVIPANTIGPNGVIAIDWCFGRDTTLSAAISWAIDWTGVVGNPPQVISLTAAQRLSRAHLLITGVNSNTSQRSSGVSPDTSGYGSATTVPIATGLDMTQAQTLNLSARLSDGADTAFLFNYYVTAAFQA